MKVGLIGLGKMGLNLGQNLIGESHDVVAYDLDSGAIEEMESYGAKGTTNIVELIKSLEQPRIIWLMVPPDSVDVVISEVTPFLNIGDILIQTGNSYYKDTIRRYNRLKRYGVSFMDVVSSEGKEGARKGTCFKIGGDLEAWRIVEPIFRDISVENGYLYTGKAGGGHFLKMTNNGIDYEMDDIGEGLELLEKRELEYNSENVARVWKKRFGYSSRAYGFNGKRIF
jgi:6-phosphogluconate dehydrogenase